MHARVSLLLFWEKLLLFYMTGIWGLRYPGVAGFLFFVQAVLWIRSSRSLLWMLLACGTGYLAASLAFPAVPQGDLPGFIVNRDKVRISGVVQKTTTKPGKRERMILEKVRVRGKGVDRDLPGRMVLNWYDARQFVLPGQHISLSSRVNPVHSLANHGVWNSEFYWHKQGVFWRSYASKNDSGVRTKGRGDWWSRMRHALMDRVSKSMDALGGGWSTRSLERVKGMAQALLFGERFYLDQEFVDLVRRASLGHSLALSGMHLGMLIFLGWLLAGGVGALFPAIYLYLPRPRLAFCIAAPLCMAYIWMGQAPHSLVRSGLMFFFWGIFVWRGRGRNLTDALFGALALILVFSPLAIFDLSLQLSALAVAGICVFKNYMRDILLRIPSFFLSRVAVYFTGLLLITLAVNIFLLPVQAWSFGYLSPHLYLNLLWIPVMGLIVLPLAFTGLLLSLVSPGIAGFVFWCMGVTINLFAGLLTYMDARNWLDPVLVIRPHWGLTLLYYFLVLGSIYCFGWYRHFKRILALGSAVLIAACFPWISSGMNDSLCLSLMDVGQGQSIFIRTPAGQRTIIDGGGSWNLDYDLGKRAVVPALAWGRWPGAENCILSHADMDHLRGLFYPLAHADIGTFWFNGRWPDKIDGRILNRSLQKGGEKVRVLREGDVLSLSHGVKLQVLHPPGSYAYPEDNDNSLVLRLVWKGHGLALLPGDIEKDAIRGVLDSGRRLSAQVLLLPHHGSRTSFYPRLYERVDPEISLVSAGFLNYFHMPHEKVTNYFRQRDIPVLNTAHQGQIDVAWESPGAEPRICTFRNKEPRY